MTQKNDTKKKYTLAELTQGLDVTIHGDPESVIEGVCTIQEARPGCITFLMNPLYKKYLPTTRAAAVILMSDYVEYCPVTTLISPDPYYTYAKIATYFDDKTIPAYGIHATAHVGKNCQIDSSVSIGPNCVIGDNVTLGPNVVLAPNCVIGEQVEIGEGTYLNANVTFYHKIKCGSRVLIGSGTVIGSDGFGIAKHKGKWQKVPQLGQVIIGNDVEIGANCAIDRGAIGDTILEKGVKLDNLIQIGHNVRIGENTAIAALVGICGSVTIGKNCLVGGQAGFAGHLTIADDVVITAGSGVTRSIDKPGIYSSGMLGVIPTREWKKNSARINRLDKLIERVKTLEAIVLESKVRKET